MAGKIARRIDFYHIVPVKTNISTDKVLDFDSANLEAEFATITDDNRVQPWGEKMSIALWPMKRPNDNFAWFKCGKGNKNDIGDLMKNGKLLNWTPPVGAEPIHSCHIVFFENKYMAIEFSHKAPTANQIELYLREKALKSFRHHFELAACEDFQKELEKAGTINLFEFTASRSNLAYLKDTDPALADSLDSAMDACGAGTIRIEMRYDKGQPEIFNDKIVQKLKKWHDDKTGRSKSVLRFARYRSVSDEAGSHFTDLFKDKVSEEREIDEDAKGNVDSVAAYDTIVAIYGDNTGRLATATAIRDEAIRKALEEKAKKNEERRKQVEENRAARAIEKAKQQEAKKTLKLAAAAAKQAIIDVSPPGTNKKYAADGPKMKVAEEMESDEDLLKGI